MSYNWQWLSRYININITLSITTIANTKCVITYYRHRNNYIIIGTGCVHSMVMMMSMLDMNVDCILYRCDKVCLLQSRFIVRLIHTLHLLENKLPTYEIQTIAIKCTPSSWTYYFVHKLRFSFNSSGKLVWEK